MFTRIIVALAGLLAILGFVATPAANGSDAEFVGSVRLFELQDRNTEGNLVVVPEAEIPPSCSAVPSGLATVRSAQNDTTDSGTSIDLYTGSTCAMATLVARIPPGGFDDAINLPQGAGFWRATP